MNILELQNMVIPSITELLGTKPEGISSMEKTSEGWAVVCNILERKAVPETFDLLKVFEFILDKEGKIVRFKQLRKIRRGDTD